MMYLSTLKLTAISLAVLATTAILLQGSADAQSKPATAATASRPVAAKTAVTTTPSPTATKTSASQPAINLSPKALAYDERLPAIFRAQADEWATEGKKIAPNLHLLETEHFLIYSSWPAKEDAGLKQTIEQMYACMCQQFDVSVKEQYWIGKLPIFAFGDNDHFAKFSADVIKAKGVDPKVNPGYCMSNSSGFATIVMNKAETLAYFGELLTHEASHAFIARYISNVHIPTWVNEGVAEYMAATVPKGIQTIAANRYISATKDAIVNKKSIDYIFDKWTGESFDYGIGQSLVRFLIARDSKAFIKFVQLLKEKKSQDDALQEAYKLTRDQLVAEWTKACSKIK